MSEQIRAFFAHFMTALSNCSLYSDSHAAVLEFSRKAFAAAESLFADDQLSFMILGDSMTVNSVPFPAAGIHVKNFIKKMRRTGIDKVIMTRGVSAEEIKTFVSELASGNRQAASHPHIMTGIVQVQMEGSGINVQAVTDENVQRVRDVYSGVSRFRHLDMIGLEDIVISFISTLRQEANVLKIMSPIKSYSEYTYTHNTNVAVLSIFQAETLRLRNDIIHDIGLAGLLHDVGKMFIAKEVLNKQGKLEVREWQEMRKHPVYGAIYLAELDVPRAAVIAAYEHHIKYDGSGYPDTKKNRKQHLMSQIIAIADFFDALRTERPYRTAMDAPEIMSLMKEAAGKDFNPVLVENFVQSMRRVAGVVTP